jgi:4-hydroxythreonine-4-phosphate dehydrogenase
VVCLADRDMLQERSAKLGLGIAPRAYDPAERAAPGSLSVAHEPLAVPSEPGRLDARNSAYVLRLIDRAIAATLSGEFDAMVTAPVQKSVINEAGIAFTGHTEYLAERLRAVPVMMLATGDLRVALATTHLPLREVSAALTIDSLCATATTLADELRRGFGIAEPRIAVCGLNPHAGEGGYLGDEEDRIIGPAIARLQSRGIRATGPVPADTAFVPQVLARCDAVLAMYHDQGLPVVKHAGFEHAVNVTLGLPIVRTSPDHGTALDLAGSGRADERSLLAAVQLAARLAAKPR